MKKRGLFLVTVLTFLFSGFWMARAGWFQEQRSGRPAPQQRPAQARTPQGGFDPMTSTAAWRYRRNQPSNWRTVLLYR